MHRLRRKILTRTSAAFAVMFSGPAAAAPDSKAPQPEAAAPAVLDDAKIAEQTFEKSALGVELEVRRFELPNGLRVFVLEDHSTPAVALHLAYDVGSRDEEPGRTGFAHFFEHMMFKGSENVPEGKHFDLITQAGGQINAFTLPERTQYFEIIPSRYLEQVLWLEADRMRSLDVNEENFANQRSAIKEEKAMRVDNAPYAKALLEFNSKIWEGTGYGHHGIGTEADLDAATTADVKAFFDRYYVPNNAVMAIVGDVQYDDVKRMVAQYFGDIPRGSDRAPFPAVDHSQSAPLEMHLQDPLAQQSLLLVGWKTVPAEHADHHALSLLMNILLRGNSSRITKVLQDEKKLVLASIAVPPGMLGGGHDAGAAFGIYLPVQGASFDAIKTVIKSEVGRARKAGVTAKELEKAVNQITVDTMNELSTNNGRSSAIAENVLAFDDPTRVLTDLEKYQSVTLADIKRVANQYLTDNWLVLEVEPKS